MNQKRVQRLVLAGLITLSIVVVLVGFPGRQSSRKSISFLLDSEGLCISAKNSGNGLAGETLCCPGLHSRIRNKRIICTEPESAGAKRIFPRSLNASVFPVEVKGGVSVMLSWLTGKLSPKQKNKLKYFAIYRLEAEEKSLTRLSNTSAKVSKNALIKRQDTLETGWALIGTVKYSAKRAGKYEYLDTLPDKRSKVTYRIRGVLKDGNALFDSGDLEALSEFDSALKPPGLNDEFESQKQKVSELIRNMGLKSDPPEWFKQRLWRMLYGSVKGRQGYDTTAPVGVTDESRLKSLFARIKSRASSSSHAPVSSSSSSEPCKYRGPCDPVIIDCANPREFVKECGTPAALGCMSFEDDCKLTLPYSTCNALGIGEGFEFSPEKPPFIACDQEDPDEFLACGQSLCTFLHELKHGGQDPCAEPDFCKLEDEAYDESIECFSNLADEVCLNAAVPRAFRAGATQVFGADDCALLRLEVCLELGVDAQSTCQGAGKDCSCKDCGDSCDNTMAPCLEAYKGEIMPIVGKPTDWNYWVTIILANYCAVAEAVYCPKDPEPPSSGGSSTSSAPNQIHS